MGNNYIIFIACCEEGKDLFIYVFIHSFMYLFIICYYKIGVFGKSYQKHRKWK